MSRNATAVRAGRVVAALTLCGLAGYLAAVGLDRADPLAGVLSLFVAVAALLAPYLLPPPGTRAPGTRAPETRAAHDAPGPDAEGSRATFLWNNRGVQYNERGGGTQHNTFNG